MDMVTIDFLLIGKMFFTRFDYHLTNFTQVK